jgi:hypothetical protein
MVVEEEESEGLTVMDDDGPLNSRRSTGDKENPDADSDTRPRAFT